MRWGPVAAGALVALAFSAGPAAASCVGPYIDDQPPDGEFGATPPTVAPGGRITIYGHWYTSTCNDTGQNDPLEPLPPVHVTAVFPGGTSVDVGTFEPSGRSMGFSTAIQVPADTPAGVVAVEDGLDNGTAGQPDYTFTVDPAGVADATIEPTAAEEPTAAKAPEEDGETDWLAFGVTTLLAMVAAAMVVLRRASARTP